MAAEAAPPAEMDAYQDGRLCASATFDRLPEQGLPEHLPNSLAIGGHRNSRNAEAGVGKNYSGVCSSRGLEPISSKNMSSLAAKPDVPSVTERIEGGIINDVAMKNWL